MIEPKFNIGDICVLKNDESYTTNLDLFKYDGEECEVKEVILNWELFSKEPRWKTDRPLYRIIMRDGRILVAKEHELILKKDQDWLNEKMRNLLDFPLPAIMLQDELVEVE
jgi:hypothetical protein